MLVSALVAEDHDLTRKGICSLLEDQLDARVAATTGDGLEVFPLVEEHRPDLLILDLGLPHLNGLDVLRRIEESSQSVRIVVHSMHGYREQVSTAFEFGAAGYVLKGAPEEELVQAIRTVVSGDRYLSSEIPEVFLDSARSTDDDRNERFELLTDREREVLQLTAEGYTSKEIGEHLYISHRTVEKHRENIQTKLGLKSVVEMTTYAYRRGLILSEPDLGENSCTTEQESDNDDAGTSE